MCGICGLISPERTDHDLVGTMNDLLRHRGPNSSGLWSGGPVSLGQRRLSILDLSEAGRQPMHNEDNSVHLVCNGEVYNYLDLNSVYLGGHRFTSRSDSETLLHLYEEQGLDFLAQTNGMFAFALWDERERRLVAGVDRLGKKPLYYAEHNGRLAFASEMKSLLLLPWVRREVDLEAIDHYLSFRHVPAPLTMLRGVKKLPPASMLVWKDGALRVWRYWEVEPADETPYDATARETFRDLFTDAVKIRMQSDVPLGLYLSGGVDSAAVGGVMRELEPGGRREAYTVSVDYKYDEGPRARAIADHLGYGFHEVRVRPDDFDLFDDISWHLDEPFGDIIALPSYLLAREAKKSLTVTLTGDGADEILSGYFHHKVMRLRQGSAILKNRVFAALGGSAAACVPCAAFNALFDYPDRIGPRERRKIAEMLSSGGQLGRFYESLTSCFSPQDKAALYGGDLAGQLRGFAPVREHLERDLAPRPGFSFTSVLGLADIKYWLPYSVLFRLDKLNMAHAVETRSPFLDYRVVQFAMNLAEAGRGGARNKEVLRWLIEGLFPPQLREKGKQAFYMPITDTWRLRFRQWVDELLSPQALAARGLFNHAYVEELLRVEKKGSMLANRQLSALAMLELWFRTFMDQPPRTTPI